MLTIPLSCCECNASKHCFQAYEIMPSQTPESSTSSPSCKIYLWCVDIECGIGGHHGSPPQKQQDSFTAWSPHQDACGYPTQQQGSQQCPASRILGNSGYSFAILQCCAVLGSSFGLQLTPPCLKAAPQYVKGHAGGLGCSASWIGQSPCAGTSSVAA